MQTIQALIAAILTIAALAFSHASHGTLLDAENAQDSVSTTSLD